MITKNELDKLVKKYECENFILSDPIQFPHRFKRTEDIELSGFITSMFSYGNRKVFIKKLTELFELMENEPVNFIKNGEFKLLQEIDFNYRFSKCDEIIEVLKILSKLYNTSKGLSELFENSYNGNIEEMFSIVIKYFYKRCSSSIGKGFYHLLPNPDNGGAMKRMNMFLRWLVRKSKVDLGLWEFIPKSELLIPLDVHVSRLSREMGLLNNCKSNNMNAVKELTENLKKFDANDPIKYDFAIFGKGIEESNRT